MEALSKDT
uniref:Uncharacterized protein n=1 Tax=Candidatus Kentrum sp. LFY TaxID=2126342 RepID=A0A450VA16_9GAMM|nr:MAG: hypothetical protein BECKLFY1418A_GA0070994_11545 [Candidatus Kentron sp. LFY]